MSDIMQNPQQPNPPPAQTQIAYSCKSYSTAGHIEHQLPAPNTTDTVMASNASNVPLKLGTPSNLYEVLGVNPGPALTQRQIHKAYLKRAAEVHPDKQPPALNAEAAVAFDRVSLAYKTLSDAELRSAYDSLGGASSAALAPTAGAIDTGDRWFAAMAAGFRCHEVLPLMRLLPAIEARFGLGLGSLTAVNGRSWPGLDHDCDGGAGCELVQLTPEVIPGLMHRALLCRAHAVVHQCGPRCSSSTKDFAACPIWASTLGRRHREAVSAAWSVQTSLPTDPIHPKRPYWHNAAAGMSIWLPELPTAKSLAPPTGPPTGPNSPPTGPVTQHVCTAAKCSRSGFIQLDGCIWACRASSTVHVCTPTQCSWTDAREIREGGPARMVCWATKRPVDVSISADWGHASKDRPTGHAADTTAGEQRLLTFADGHGHAVTTLIERPTGTDVGEAVGEPSWRQLARHDFSAVYGAQRDKAIQFDARVRDTERDATTLLEEVLEGGDGAICCRNLRPQPSDSMPSTKRRRGLVAVAAPARPSKTSRLDRIKIQLVSTAQRVRRDEFVVSDVPGEGIEIDADDLYSSAELTYNTFHRPGPPSSWGHGDHDVDDQMDRMDTISHEALREELTSAMPRFLRAADPRAPIEYHCSAIEWARGAIGAPHPDDPGHGQLRVYNGRTIIVMQPA